MGGGPKENQSHPDYGKDIVNSLEASPKQWSHYPDYTLLEYLTLALISNILEMSKGKLRNQMKSASSEGVCEIQAFDPTRVMEAQEHLIPQSQAQSIARGFQALGHPARLKLVGALSSGELCVCDLAQALEMPISTVSFHLKELREAEVVSFRADGRLAFYFLNKSNLVEYFHDAIERVGKTDVS